MTRRRGLAFVAAAVLFASAGLWAEEGIVHTRDGSSYKGDVTENTSNVIVKIHGVDTVIPRAEVTSIERVGNYEEEYLARLAKLDPKDVNGRLLMARDAIDHNRYDLARNTLEATLAIDPNSRAATDLLDLVQSHIRMERAKQEATTAPQPTPASRPAVVTQLNSDRRVLTSADIEAIRRKEMRPSDVNARIRFDGDVKKRFADSQNISYADFTSLPTVEQAIQILDKGDETMRDKVHVLSDPQSILDYRRQIQPLVIQNCATIGCHGGPSGGSLLLYTAVENDPVTYTNFYILQSYTKKGSNGTGVFSGGLERMIYRGHGEDSLLANYGLPSTVATYDHPLVNGKRIQTIFRNRSDARYLAVVDWMNNSLAPIAPDYGIHYTPPTAPAPVRATTMPSTNPAGAP